jgi:hypothetical protein
MINLLLNRLINLEVRVKYLEEENKKLKNQSQGNIHFGQCTSIGPSGTANNDGFIMVISGCNENASITIDGNNVQYVDRRDKYGQGRVSCCSPISKGSSWSCIGERIYFIPLLSN